jgi:hypothetical protein
MCTCGAKFQAESIPAVWQLMDAHIDAVHGRRFPLGAHHAINTGPGAFRRRIAPLTPQGGNS